MNSGQKSIVITAAVRTAIGTFNGSLKDIQGHELGSIVAKDVLKKSNLNITILNWIRSSNIKKKYHFQ